MEPMTQLSPLDPIFERNRAQAERLRRKHVAFVGCGSGGGSLAVMAARAGVERFTLVDPDILAVENLGRHVLTRADLGKPKVEGLKRMILDLNPQAEVEAVAAKFDDLAQKPDLIVAGTDSFECESFVNDFALLVLGESGTGKEVLAQYIHKMSSRATRCFLKVNCAAMPADLLESELFGYEQGAFTGAIKSKPGKFELCDNGTILLDEIGEMAPMLQAKLL